MNAAQRFLLVVSVGIAPTLASGQTKEPSEKPKASPSKEQEGAEKPAPKAAEAPRAENNQVADRALGQAFDALRAENYVAAIQAADEALRASKEKSDRSESAEFALAEALAGLDFSQAANEFYLSVVETRSNPSLLPRALLGLGKLARANKVDEEKLLTGILAASALDNVPPEVADLLSYYRGLSNLRHGYSRWATTDFAGIRGTADFAQEAHLVRIVALVHAKKLKEASAMAEQVRKKELLPDIADRLTVLEARLAFETKDYKRAAEKYEMVARTVHASQAELLLERAWSHYHQAEYHDAMGLLLALDAPSNRAVFLADRFILEGLIYQNLCHFRAAKESIREFRRRYGDTLLSLHNGLLPQSDKGVQSAARVLLPVRRAWRLVETTQAEAKRAQDMQNALGKKSFGPRLVRIYELLRARAEEIHRRRVDVGAQEIAETLLETEEQANLLAYEVGVSIFKPVQKQLTSFKLRTLQDEVPSSGDKAYFPFDDEYWTDELKDMEFIIDNRCTK